MTYFWLGVEHFLLGLDHILFLLGLMLLSTTLWTRIVALSMFTLAHGLTMGAATLGLAWAPSPVVELLIAASVLHLAREVIHQERTWTRRAPAAVALGIGLVHGFGFAGVFGELSLPEGEMLLGLGLFHLGLEAGQLLVVLIGWPLWLIASRWLEASSVTRTAGYAIGMAAGVMVVERVASWVQWLSV